MVSTKDLNLLIGIGPIFVCSALSLSPITGPLFLLATLGTMVCFIWHLRGLVYAGIGLTLLALWQFAFVMPENPWWHLGLLGSLGLSFLITALSGQLFASVMISLHSQWEARGAALSNLEEEMVQLQDTNAIGQVALREKISELQKLLEETQSDHSSLLVLNEVLRKTSSRHMAETASMKASLEAFQVRYALMMQMQEALEKQVAHFQATDAVVIENRQLVDALHAAKLQTEQTHLINETLARLHAKEHLRSQMLVAQESSARETLAQTTLLLEETRALSSAYKDQLVLASNQIATQRESLVSIEACLDQMKAHVQETPPVDLTQYVPKEEMEHVQQKAKELAQVEALYRQLKAQFEEKNKVLHEVRKDLFRAETTLETMKMEKEAQDEGNACTAFPEIVRELGLLDEECARLQEENEELQRLVSALNVLPPTMSPKKEKGDKKNFLQPSFFEI